MEEDPNPPGQNTSGVRDKLVLTDPKEIRVVLHEQKLQIMKILVHEMKNIQELREMTHINPGTIKRNLDELMAHGLVYIAAIKKSDYNITMKYYHATVHRIEISFKLGWKRLRNPPEKIDGAKVLFWASSPVVPFFVMPFSDGSGGINIHGIAICQYDTGEVYRFSCDENWAVQNDSDWDCVVDAMTATSTQYDVTKVKWHKRWPLKVVQLVEQPVILKGMGVLQASSIRLQKKDYNGGWKC